MNTQDTYNIKATLENFQAIVSQVQKEMASCGDQIHSLDMEINSKDNKITKAQRTTKIQEKARLEKKFQSLKKEEETLSEKIAEIKAVKSQLMVFENKKPGEHILKQDLAAIL